jgi:hypothetical protein
VEAVLNGGIQLAELGAPVDVSKAGGVGQRRARGVQRDALDVDLRYGRKKKENKKWQEGRQIASRVGEVRLVVAERKKKAVRGKADCIESGREWASLQPSSQEVAVGQETRIAAERCSARQRERLQGAAPACRPGLSERVLKHSAHPFPPYINNMSHDDTKEIPL